MRNIKDINDRAPHRAEVIPLPGASTFRLARRVSERLDESAHAIDTLRRVVVALSIAVLVLALAVVGLAWRLASV